VAAAEPVPAGAEAEAEPEPVAAADEEPVPAAGTAVRAAQRLVAPSSAERAAGVAAQEATAQPPRIPIAEAPQ